MLPLSDFKTLVRNGILPSIDLVIRNQNKEVLLGKRLNAPAKNKWFVPGGRILKNERIMNALQRIIHSETGLDIEPLDAKFLGVYEHIYKNNYFGDSTFNTHYIVIAFGLDIEIETKPKQIDYQHKKYKFFSTKKLLSLKNVHQYTKSYFIKHPSNLAIQPSNNNFFHKI